MGTRTLWYCASLALCCFVALQARADSLQISPQLAGHTVLPAATVTPAPGDAPENLLQAGKYTTGKRESQIGAVMGLSGARKTGLSLPVAGQSVQGFSGIKRMNDGYFWVLTDNGFGTKANSPDAMLFLNHYNIDFPSGAVKEIGRIFLHDPDGNVPFHIVNESTEQRYLTGSDFDLESFQFAGGFLWIGDEFGPYPIKADMKGKVLAVFETVVDGSVVKFPNNSTQPSPGRPDSKPSFQVSRSKGFEGMASSPDGSKLYPMLEGPLWDYEKNDFESVDGAPFVRILEFDVTKEEWTGRSWKYVLDKEDNSIGDFNMIDDEKALIIERDNGEGSVKQVCESGQEATGECFAMPAQYKKIHRVSFNGVADGQAVKKEAFIDLMAIEDPHKLARVPLTDGMLTFPFMTIENVDVVDQSHIIVANDNNYPFSAGRELHKADDNEFILLRVPELLK